MATLKLTSDPMLAMEFKRAICSTFCPKNTICDHCPANKISAKTYRIMKIGDLIGIPRKRRRK